MTDSQVYTRSRLLEAAGDVFSRKGYRATTVREICRKARANVASINYHFGSKENLYLELLRLAHDQAAADAPLLTNARAGENPEAALRRWIQSTLALVVAKGRHAWFDRLMLWEMLDPTPAVAAFVEGTILPRTDELKAIIIRLLGSDARERTVSRCAQSVVGQCRYYAVEQPVRERAFSDARLDETHLSESWCSSVWSPAAGGTARIQQKRKSRRRPSPSSRPANGP